MILEIETMGRSFAEVELDVYDAMYVYGLTDGEIAKQFNIDNYGDIVEVEVNRWDSRDPAYYEEVLTMIEGDLGMTYNVTLL